MMFTHLVENHSGYDFLLHRTFSDGACRMDEKEVNFSLSYEQLFQEAEKQIKKRNLSRTGEFYVHEKIMANDILMFWHSLALRGYRGSRSNDVKNHAKRLIYCLY
jgi:hypothetical protein